MREVFLAWEKLRLIYIAILALPTLGIGVVAGMAEVVGMDELGFYGFRALFGAVAANILFFAGPSVEAYAVWLGLPHHRALRIALFACGTIFSLLIGVPYLLFPV